MLSDVKKGNNLMLTCLTPVATRACADASDHVRSLLCAIFACWYHSGVMLKFDQLYHSNFLTKLRFVSS